MVMTMLIIKLIISRLSISIIDNSVLTPGSLGSIWHKAAALIAFCFYKVTKFVLFSRTVAAVLCVLLVSYGNIYSASAADASSEKIVATVNGEPIYEKEVGANMPPDAFGAHLKYQRRFRLENLIYTKVLKQFLESKKILVDDERIEKEIAYLRKYPPSPGCVCHTFTTFEQFMKLNNYTLDDLRDEIRVNMGLGKYIDKLWLKKYETEKKRSDLLKENRLAIEAQYVNVSHIFFSFFKDPEYESMPVKVENRKMSKAMLAYERLKKGEKFEVLARNLSEDLATRDKGGDLGLTDKKLFGKQFADAAEKLSSGQYSEPVKSIWGVHIIKRVGISDQELMDMIKSEFKEETQPLLIKQLVDEAEIVKY